MQSMPITQHTFTCLKLLVLPHAAIVLRYVNQNSIILLLIVFTQRDCRCDAATIFGRLVNFKLTIWGQPMGKSLLKKHGTSYQSGLCMHFVVSQQERISRLNYACKKVFVNFSSICGLYRSNQPTNQPNPTQPNKPKPVTLSRRWGTPTDASTLRPIDACLLQRGATMTLTGPSIPWCCPFTIYAAYLCNTFRPWSNDLYLRQCIVATDMVEPR